MLRKLFFSFVSVALPQVFFTYVPTQAFAVDFVSLTDISDDPDAFIGKTLTTRAWIFGEKINPKKINNLNGDKIFDGALLLVTDSTRKGGESFGNNFGLISDELNIVMRNKKMARDLKDAFTANGLPYDCTATVSLEKLSDRPGREYTIMIIHAIEATVFGGEKVRIGEDNYDK